VTGGLLREFTERLREAARNPLNEEQILAWADSHYERLWQWPRVGSGAIDGTPGEKWANVNAALEQGLRGLPGGSSLARLLAEQRGIRNMADLPPLSVEQILRWADAHYGRTRRWPKQESDGPILDAPGETWKGIQMALVNGRRGLPSGSSLPQLLTEQRGVRNHYDLPALSIDQILAWADLHRRRTGKWPNEYCGAVADAPNETWARINTALFEGIRGLSGSSSLARLLAKHRGKRNHLDLSDLTEKQILAWADAHHGRTETWPTEDSGAVADAPNETWRGITKALRNGSRGLPGGSSLAQLLTDHRGKRNHLRLSHLTIDQILIWADSYHAKFGTWPKVKSGAVADAPGETWNGIEHALRSGNRGLPRGSSLARLLASQRGVRTSRGFRA
jgi:hypothetical protein